MDSTANQPLEVESFTRPGTITPGKTVLAYLHEWIVTVDHKKLGIMYILYALLFLVVGGVEAMLIRLQLSVPNNHLVGPQTFNQLFTMHGIHRNLQRDVEAKPTILPDLGHTINGPFLLGVGIQNINRQCAKKTRQIASARAECQRSLKVYHLRSK